VSKPSAAWIFGGVIAVLFVIIRNLGGYPDAVAFSVLLGNACAPLISIMTRRREFGQGFKPENIND
jgi:electron transport complex protein RnfD